MGQQVQNENNSFGNAIETNNHIAKLLLVDNDFILDIGKVRKDFLVPESLESFSDITMDGFRDLASNSDQLFKTSFINDSLNKEDRAKIKKAIYNILKKYQLSIIFFSWVQWLILYRKPYYFDIEPDNNFFHRMKDSIGLEELFRIPKNTRDKKLLLEYYRELFKLPKTGRIPKEHSKDYAYFRSILNRKKVSFRKPKVDHSIDVDVINKHGKKILIEGKNVKNTYMQLVTEFYPEAPFDEDIKRSQNLRKKKERVLKQIKKLKN